MAIRMVWWDVDGVLVVGPGFSDLLPKLGIRREDTAAFFLGPFQDCLCGRAELAQVLPPFLRKWGWHGTVQEFLAEWFQSERTLNDVVWEWLAHFKQRGVAQYLATNQEAARLAYLMAHLGLQDFVAGTLASCNLKARKPTPDYFARALAATGVSDPGSVLFWDDQAANVEAARTAGLEAHQYQGADAFRTTMARLLFVGPATS